MAKVLAENHYPMFLFTPYGSLFNSPSETEQDTPSKYLTLKLFSRIHIQTTVHASLFAYSKKAHRQEQSTVFYVQFQLRAAPAL